VFRLKVEWRGYGRALYLRHPNGRVTVYGHLERYEDSVLKLERRVARRQAETHTRYPGDIYLDPPVRVRRGQVIAYSGESGVGLPHLHFEVRDHGDAPVNPFDAGLPWPKDSRRPVLELLTITSAAPATFIDGEKREEVYPLRAGGDGVRTTGRPVRVSGPFLAAVRAHDPAGNSGRSGVRGVEMTIDGSARYRLEFHSFGFGQFPQSGLIYDHRTSRLGPAAFTYRLVRLPGNELSSATALQEGRPAAGYPGALDLEPGPHLMEVSVVDSAGNRSRARVCLQVGHPAAAESLTWEGDGPGRASVIVRFPAGEPARPSTTETRAGAPACPPSPARTVEGEFWDDQQNAFRPMTCSPVSGRCVGDAVPAARSRAVRVRESRDGVPGPWRILAASPTRLSRPPDEPPGVDAWPSFLDILAPADILANPALLLVAGAATTPILPLTYRSGQLWGAAVPYEEVSGRSPLSVVGGDPRGPAVPLVLDVRWAFVDRSLQYQGPGFALTLPVSARFFAGPLVVRTDSIAGPGPLPAVSEAVDLLPEGEALKDPATLAFDLIPGAVPPESLGIYRYDAGRERWGFDGGDVDAGGATIALRFRRYGRFALLQDASPPQILEVRPAPGSRGVPRRVAVQARVEDEGKGLNFDGVTFAIDDLLQEAEFDPDRGLARGLAPQTLSPGRHHIRVEAIDRAGNRSAVVEGDFEVR
jgi:hypothetical protein